MRVLVRNSPLLAYADGWVEVPDGVADEALHDAIAASLRENGYTPINKPPTMELDDFNLDGWEFDIGQRVA